MCCGALELQAVLQRTIGNTRNAVDDIMIDPRLLQLSYRSPYSSTFRFSITFFISFGDGDDDGDSLAEADSAGSDASGSDSSVTVTGRGRSSAPDRRRLGSGSGVKREKREPVPVSPPRQSIIAAAHEAEVGSQIKVKFDTGHWFGGTILEVDSQRWVLL